MAPFGSPGRYRQADFALETRRQLALLPDLTGSGKQGAGRRALFPDKPAIGIQRNAPVENAIVPPGHDMGRHGVEQFIGQHHTGEMVGQAIQPAHPRQQVGRRCRNSLLLPLAQIGRQIKDEIALRQPIQAFQFEQEIRRQAPGAGADLQHER
ncbi:hypothetical protein SDC9_165067 [bioreactor metagenome]|uniref:Uncharacterized protein n=1 Tax=bioreactor metagenome TaxID=1076179 RepID=A0A645FVN9_9ZZZZ